MSIHVCRCLHNGCDEWHLRYPGMREKEAQSLADRINAGALYAPIGRQAREDARQLRLHAAGLTYNDTTAEAEAKHRLHEIAMRIESGFYRLKDTP